VLGGTKKEKHGGTKNRWTGEDEGGKAKRFHLSRDSMA